MIIQSLIIASIICNSVGLSAISNRLDQAVVRAKFNTELSAAVASDKVSVLPPISERPQVKMGADKASIYAKEYILADADSGKILLKEGHKEQVPIASTTKIMTAIVVLENYKLGDVVTISSAASNQIGASANFVTGEHMTVENLLKAMLIKSANGAAYALAEYANKPGETGTTRFVKMMNDKAKELGMSDTDYHDPAGLDTTGYSSAYDLFLATRYALKKDLFAEIVKTDHASIRNVEGTIWHELKNSNRLVAEYQYPGAIGVKTGYMPEAGHVLVSAARRNGHTLVGVIINTFADTAPASADESRKLLDWGFGNVTWQ